MCVQRTCLVVTSLLQPAGAHKYTFPLLIILYRADRKENAQNVQAKAMKKREDNISARLQQKKDKKMGVKPGKSVGKGNSKKKGRPGFEGKGGSKRK